MKDEYLQSPCEVLATAFWKEKWFPKPEGISIALEKNIAEDSPLFDRGVRYFRLIHRLKKCEKPVLPESYEFRNVLLPGESGLVADIINKCYEGYSQTKENVLRWREYPVFDNELWILVWDKKSNLPAALGIADFDSDIGEGSLEWIQVLPHYRGKGLGEAVVLELLSRLKSRAGFVTVSGEVENITNPERLYRKCGFVGDAIWVVAGA